MVLFVSGENKITIEGFLNETAHLPCNCSGIDLSKGFRWQKQGRNDVVFQYEGANNVPSKYKRRVHLMSTEGGVNCGVRLTNIQIEDQGTYECLFQTPVYKIILVELKVSARYDICEKNKSAKVFHCDVKGHYRDAWIQWILDGNILKNSTMDNMTNSSWSSSPGHYHFHSKLITNRNLTAIPSCEVAAKGIPTTLNEICEPEKGGQKEIPQNSMLFLVIIPVSLVLGVSIYLCHRLRLSRRQQGELEYKLAENGHNSVDTLPG